MTPQGNEFKDRLKKLEQLRKQHIDPYKASAERDFLIAQVHQQFSEFKSSKKDFSLAGRLRSFRLHGNILFADLQDQSGRIQLVVNKQNIGAEQYKLFKDTVDVGDFIQAKGHAYTTQKGEDSLEVISFEMLTKALRPLPDTYYGFKNEEERLRKRYLDIMYDRNLYETLIKKAKFWQSVRNFLIARSFIEVETPVLETTTGGADARPFITHHNALDIDVYLRISVGELWQKRLMVAGFEKTFEIGRQFRNEGMDAEHLQDYTQMEFYWAYADYRDGMKLVEELYKHVAQETFGTLQFKIGTFDIDLAKKWELYDYQETVKKYTGIDVLNTTLEQIEVKLGELGVSYSKEGFNITRAIDNLWKYCRKQIAGPGFLVGVPVAISPLAKRDAKRPELSQRFQPIIAGSELGNGYSELNDPIDQAARFAEQLKLREAGDDEAQMYDHDFVEALEYGMPPTCGFGMSERVFSFLCNRTLRESQTFPLVRPQHAPQQTMGRAQSAEKASSAHQTSTSHADPIDAGITPDQALAMVRARLKNKNLVNHSRAVGVIMAALAHTLHQPTNAWEIAGTLHDLDYEDTQSTPEQHGLKTAEELERQQIHPAIIQAIRAHNPKNGTQAQSTVDHALYASDPVSGFLVACALVRPDKKLASLQIDSVMKKFADKTFAKGASRDAIASIERLGVSVRDFLTLSLKALQDIHDELGL